MLRLLLLAAVALPCGAQTQAERLAAAEREMAAAQVICGAWKPGAGLTLEGSVRRGWVHSITPGRHELHIKGGKVMVFGQPTNVFEQQAGTGRDVTQGYHLIRVEAPTGSVLEWTRPDGVREPVPSIYLYPVAR